MGFFWAVGNHFVELLLLAKTSPENFTILPQNPQISRPEPVEQNWNANIKHRHAIFSAWRQVFLPKAQEAELRHVFPIHFALVFAQTTTADE